VDTNTIEVCVDPAGADFLDCSGIGALVAGRNAAIDAGCRFRIIPPKASSPVSSTSPECWSPAAIGTPPDGPPKPKERARQVSAGLPAYSRGRTRQPAYWKVGLVT
jgi:hypothetical protein